MPDLLYSDEAENVLDLFYRVDTMVYVEGQDDIPFWEYMFESLTDLNVEIQDVGSCTALTPYIDKINNGILNSVVACDSDFTSFNTKKTKSNSNIIKTYGYSIENTFICPKNLYKVIKTIARIPANKISLCNIQEWVTSFCKKINKLINLDILNHKYSLGKSVIGDNATRFMTSKNSSTLCSKKIENHVIELEVEVKDYNDHDIDSEIKEKGVELKHLIRGHFLFSAIARYVSCFIKSLGIKVSVSNDSLYSALILSFPSVFNENHPEYNYYSNALSNIRI